MASWNACPLICGVWQVAAVPMHPAQCLGPVEISMVPYYKEAGPLGAGEGPKPLMSLYLLPLHG